MIACADSKRARRLCIVFAFFALAAVCYADHPAEKPVNTRLSPPDVTYPSAPADDLESWARRQLARESIASEFVDRMSLNDREWLDRFLYPEMHEGLTKLCEIWTACQEATGPGLFSEQNADGAKTTSSQPTTQPVPWPVEGVSLSRFWYDVGIRGMGGSSSANPRIGMECGADITRMVAFKYYRIKLGLHFDQWNRLDHVEANVFDPDPYKAPEYDRSAAYAQIPVYVGKPPCVLRGTMLWAKPHTLPYMAKAVAILVQGPDDEDEDLYSVGFRPFRDLAAGLASRGIDVLRYESRRHAHSEWYSENALELTLRDLVLDDAAAAITHLRQSPRFAHSPVYIIGYEWGAAFLPLVAKENAAVGGLILIDGRARSMFEVQKEDFERQMKESDPKRDGFFGPAFYQRRIDHLEKGRKIRSREDELALAGEMISDFGIRYPLMHRLSDEVPKALKSLEKLDQPILIMGESTASKHAEPDFEIYKRRLKTRKNVTFKWYDGRKHPLLPQWFEQADADDPSSNPPLHVDEQLIDDIAAWILKQSSTKRSSK